MPTCGCKVSIITSPGLSMLQNTLAMIMHIFSLTFFKGTPSFNACVSLFFRQKGQYFRYSSQTNIGFLEIESYQRHLLVHKHYNAESPSLHDQQQLDIIKLIEQCFYFIVECKNH